MKFRVFVVIAALLFSFNVHAKKWTYEESKDEMRGVTNKWATLASENLVPLEFPYEPGAYLRLAVRHMPKQYGMDVYIQATKGHLTCRYNNCYITVKFDDGKVQRIPAVEPEDARRDALFITDGAKTAFIKKLKKARKIFVEVNLFQRPDQQFRFEPVEPLEWK